MICSVCDCTTFETDEVRCEVICAECGNVCEVDSIDTNIEYLSQNNTNQINGVVIETGYYTSKQKSIRKAHTLMASLCSKLCMPKFILEIATNLYKIVLKHRMTNGVDKHVTAGVCIYIAARTKRLPLTLLDISNKINVSVFRLGKVFKKFSSKIDERLNVVDPSWYIEGLAYKFELKDKTKSIIQTSLKLLKLMNEEFIGLAENPTTVAAAVILIASRIGGFDRNCEDVARIAHVSANSVMKLVNKWSYTKAANLELPDFQKKATTSDKASPKPIVVCHAEQNKKCVNSSSSGEELSLADSDSEDMDQYFYSPEQTTALKKLLNDQKIKSRKGDT